MLELQITKEYLGQDTHLVYLGALFEEVLDTDTHARGPGSTVARVTDGTLFEEDLNAIAGVANIGMDRNWTGSHFNQANWYAFGRLAWNPDLNAADIADEWTRATFGGTPGVVDTIRGILMDSREAVVDYMMPLGLVHIFAEGHHYGPGPWVTDLPRADWTSVYYHRADREGIGFDRTASGSNAVSQYFPPLSERFADRQRVPEKYLLYFHRVNWQEQLRSGKTLWQELFAHYDRGIASVASMRRRWAGLETHIDAGRFSDVTRFLQIQQYEARWWRDAVLSYFMSINGLDVPAGHEAPARDLEFYRSLDCPADRHKPLCPPIYE
jgi:alpha-glucuronidase